MTLGIVLKYPVFKAMGTNPNGSGKLAELASLTKEEIAAIDSLINAYTVATRNAADMTKSLQQAMASGDREAFSRTKSALAETEARCKALSLAIEIAHDTFKEAALKRNQVATTRPFDNPILLSEAEEKIARMGRSNRTIHQNTAC